MADKKNEKTGILDEGVGKKKISLIDGLMIKSAEIGVDEFSSKFKFNGSFLSGGAKAISAVVLDRGLKGKYGTDIVASGLLFDGLTDLVSAFKRKFLGKADGQTANNSNVRVM
jgi:hypothetical protein